VAGRHPKDPESPLDKFASEQIGIDDIGTAFEKMHRLTFSAPSSSDEGLLNQDRQNPQQVQSYLAKRHFRLSGATTTATLIQSPG
jgi:hypothetical protein